MVKHVSGWKLRWLWHFGPSPWDEIPYCTLSLRSRTTAGHSWRLAIWGHCEVQRLPTPRHGVSVPPPLQSQTCTLPYVNSEPEAVAWTVETRLRWDHAVSSGSPEHVHQSWIDVHQETWKGVEFSWGKRQQHKKPHTHKPKLMRSSRAF